MIASAVNLQRSLGALVAEQPGRAQLFEQLRLDYCCGGVQTLAEACAERGLDLDAVCAALRALDAAGGSDDVENVDWRARGVRELCRHIVAVHHDGLRGAFPVIDRLLNTVVRVHGAAEPSLHDVRRLVDEMRDGLTAHMASEESELFPACLAWEQSGARVDESLLSAHEHEHDTLGHTLAELRDLCHQYDRTVARCHTHRALLDALEALEHDLHRHVHEENNILLPRVRGPQPDALPRCCAAWIAEQTHIWMVHRRPR